MKHQSLPRLVALLLLTWGIHPAFAQFTDDLKIGLDVGPSLSWLNPNGNRVEGAGSRLGFRFLLNGEKYFGENYAFTFGAGMSFGQGGTLRFNTGGSFLPNSDLSDPDLNRGQKPLPDGTEITYKLSYVDLQAGLRLYTNRINLFKYFLELPIARFSILTRARGDIEASGISTEDELIGPDVRNSLFSWGLGAGAEGVLQNDMAVYGGITFTQSFSDVTKDDGRFAFGEVDDKGTDDPFDDEYSDRPRANSRDKLATLYFRVGIFF